MVPVTRPAGTNIAHLLYTILDNPYRWISGHAPGSHIAGTLQDVHEYELEDPLTVALEDSLYD